MARRRSCAACGAKNGLVRFEDEAFAVKHDGRRETVCGLSGQRCAACGDVFFDAESARRYAAAGDALVLDARARERQELKRIRRKLALSQQAAARLTGGGHNAFSRYERGEAQPLRAVVNLFKLLDKHPDLLPEIMPKKARAPRGRGTAAPGLSAGKAKGYRASSEDTGG
jgi:HTH-type transcriptional regulator/antitoxin MqsA